MLHLSTKEFYSVVGVQKCFHGYKARCQYHEAEGRVATLQSLIRDEITRKVYASLSKNKKVGANTKNHKHKPRTPKADDQQKAVVELQSAIQGALARRHLNGMQNPESLNPPVSDPEEKPARRITEAMFDDHCCNSCEDGLEAYRKKGWALATLE